MCLVVKLMTKKEQNCNRNGDVPRDEVPPVERLLTGRESLDREDKNVEEHVEAVDPDAAQYFEGIC